MILHFLWSGYSNYTFRSWLLIVSVKCVFKPIKSVKIQSPKVSPDCHTHIA